MNIFTLLFFIWIAFYIFYELEKTRTISKYGLKKRYRFLGGGVGRQPKRYQTMYYYNNRLVELCFDITCFKFRVYEAFTTKEIIISNTKAGTSKQVMRNLINQKGPDLYYSKDYEGKLPFHYGSCKYGDMIIKRRWFNTYEDAISKGLVPCKYCKPVPKK